MSSKAVETTHFLDECLKQLEHIRWNASNLLLSASIFQNPSLLNQEIINTIKTLTIDDFKTPAKQLFGLTHKTKESHQERIKQLNAFLRQTLICNSIEICAFNIFNQIYFNQEHKDPHIKEDDFRIPFKVLHSSKSLKSTWNNKTTTLNNSFIASIAPEDKENLKSILKIRHCCRHNNAKLTKADLNTNYEINIPNYHEDDPPLHFFIATGKEVDVTVLHAYSIHKYLMNLISKFREDILKKT